MGGGDSLLVAAVATLAPRVVARPRRLKPIPPDKITENNNGELKVDEVYEVFLFFRPFPMIASHMMISLGRLILV